MDQGLYSEKRGQKFRTFDCYHGCKGSWTSKRSQLELPKWEYYVFEMAATNFVLPNGGRLPRFLQKRKRYRLERAGCRDRQQHH